MLEASLFDDDSATVRLSIFVPVSTEQLLQSIPMKRPL